MTREERLAYMASLLGPMRAYLHELDEEEETGAKLMPVKRKASKSGDPDDDRVRYVRLAGRGPNCPVSSIRLSIRAEPCLSAGFGRRYTFAVFAIGVAPPVG